MNKTDFISGLLLCLTLIMLCLMVITEPVYAVPPVPARIGGEVTVNGTLLEQADSAPYTFVVTRQNGTEYLPPHLLRPGVQAPAQYWPGCRSGP